MIRAPSVPDKDARFVPIRDDCFPFCGIGGLSEPEGWRGRLSSEPIHEPADAFRSVREGEPTVPWPGDPVNALLEERGIAHYRPVDREAGEPGWPGATFQDYGARGWSVLAVIDREGRLAYLGEDFAAALKTVETRLAR